MKVFALNSSPRSQGQSKTELMLNGLVKGMRDAGAEVEMVALREKNIRNCSGCFSCWTKSPGVCIHKDDMTTELFPKWLESDLVVYAAPLYHFGINAVMKTFIERTLPVLEPFFIHQDGRTHHPPRHKQPKVVFLSVAAFPEYAVFDQLSSWANFVYGARNGSERALVAEIYRTMSGFMAIPGMEKETEEILTAVEQAGREIVASMEVHPDTMKRISDSFVEAPERLLENINQIWRTCIAEGITLKEFMERIPIAGPDSIESFTTMMPMGFNSEAAGETSAVVQFNFSGEVEGPCHLIIKDGQCEALEGTAKAPQLSIDTPFEVWMDIMTGKADGQQMFMEQKYTARGDLSLMMRMGDLFGNR